MMRQISVHALRIRLQNLARARIKRRKIRRQMLVQIQSPHEPINRHRARTHQLRQPPASDAAQDVHLLHPLLRVRETNRAHRVRETLSLHQKLSVGAAHQTRLRLKPRQPRVAVIVGNTPPIRPAEHPQRARHHSQRQNPEPQQKPAPYRSPPRLRAAAARRFQRHFRRHSDTPAKPQTPIIKNRQTQPNFIG